MEHFNYPSLPMSAYWIYTYEAQVQVIFYLK